MIYLACFYRIVLDKFGPQLDKMVLEEKIRFISTAYNHGFNNPFQEILKWQKVSYYPNGPQKISKQYRYCDLAVDFYKRIWLFDD